MPDVSTPMAVNAADAPVAKAVPSATRTIHQSTISAPDRIAAPCHEQELAVW